MVLSLIRSWLRIPSAPKAKQRKKERLFSSLRLESLEAREVPATMYNIQWLGTVSPTDNYSIARAINDNGQVVGTSGVMNAGVVNGSTNVLGPYQAYSWTASGGMVGLGTLTGSESYATAVNNNGMIAGVWHYYTIPYTPNGGGYYEWAFITQNGQMTSIPGHAQIGAHSTAQGLNDSGVVTGSTDVSMGPPYGQHQAFVYDGTTFTLLGTLGGQWSYGMDINNNGMVVGMADTGLGVPPPGATAVSLYHAFEWTAAGGMKDIGTLGGQSYANKANDSGMVVGYSEILGANGSISAYHPFLYGGTKMIDIIGGITGNSFADSINNLGQVVGGGGGGGVGATGAVAWLYQNGVTTDLNTLIPAGSGSLLEAYDINNKGQIVGLGMHNGKNDSFLLTPTTVTVPTTPTITVKGGTFTYDGMTHTATASAVGANGTPVNGSFAFTYNGSATAPTAAGTYSIIASFTSSDPSYGSATASGTLTINKAAPVFSNLSSPTISSGTASTTLSGNLAAGSIVPSGDSVSITLNGVTQTATVDASGNFSSSFATGTLSASGSPYTIAYAFAGDAANFNAAADGNGTLTVSAPSSSASLFATGLNVDATAGAPFSGTVAKFTSADLLDNASSYSATITWGDGSTTAGVVSGTASNLTVTGRHTYADPGSDTIQVTVNGSLGSATTTSNATITSLGLAAGKTKSIEFWHGKSGQALLLSFNGGANHTELASWLASYFSNLYGANAGAHDLTGKTNAAVAALYKSLWQSNADGPDVQVLATALNVYATTSSLGGSQGSHYKLQVSATGHGARLFGVGNYGSTVGVANNTKLNVFEMLRAVNNQAVNGVLYNGNTQLQNLATVLFDELNTI